MLRRKRAGLCSDYVATQHNKTHSVSHSVLCVALVSDQFIDKTHYWRPVKNPEVLISFIFILISHGADYNVRVHLKAQRGTFEEICWREMKHKKIDFCFYLDKVTKNKYLFSFCNNERLYSHKERLHL